MSINFKNEKAAIIPEEYMNSKNKEIVLAEYITILNKIKKEYPENIEYVNKKLSEMLAPLAKIIN